MGLIVHVIYIWGFPFGEPKAHSPPYCSHLTWYQSQVWIPRVSPLSLLPSIFGISGPDLGFSFRGSPTFDSCYRRLPPPLSRCHRIRHQICLDLGGILDIRFHKEILLQPSPDLPTSSSRVLRDSCCLWDLVSHLLISASSWYHLYIINCCIASDDLASIVCRRQPLLGFQDFHHRRSGNLVTTLPLPAVDTSCWGFLRR